MKEVYFIFLEQFVAVSHLDDGARVHVDVC